MSIINKVMQGDCRTVLKDFPESVVNTCVTSPPYWNLRDYGTAEWEGGDDNCDHRYYKGGHGELSKVQTQSKGNQFYQYKGECKKCGATRHDSQFGMEDDLDDYISHLADIMDEVSRILKPDGTLWLNIGDCYGGNNPINQDGRKGFSNQPIVQRKVKAIAGLHPKNLMGIPWKVAFELQDRGWILRSDIIWHKPNPMPESVKDRPTNAHEHIFLLSKQPNYYYDYKSIMEEAVTEDYTEEGKRNKRNVWKIRAAMYRGAHFATFPIDLIIPCIQAGSPKGGLVLDPFMGSGTVAFVSKRLGRDYTGVELNPDYHKIIYERTKQEELF